MKASAPCPCTSGKTYGECCAPLHRGEREPADAASLVRARYSAFALGEVEFLWNTLHYDHPDRVNHGRDKTLIALRAASSTFKYMGLTILDQKPVDEHGFAQVLYVARIFRKGVNVSFVELADFLHDGKGLRYRSGKTADASAEDPTHLTIELFAARS
jgi:SEC-C motif-containing protein